MGWSEWDRDANRNRDVLERIVALLVAFAALADLASGLPALRRRQMLTILLCGEAEARAFVLDMEPGAPAQADAPGDLEARLAASFRALARLLCAVLARRLPGAPGSRAGGRRHAGQAGHRRPAALPAPDTS